MRKCKRELMLAVDQGRMIVHDRGEWRTVLNTSLMTLGGGFRASSVTHG